MMRNPSISTTLTVTLNLFQGPFVRSSSGRAARWMLKQVQHDEFVQETVA
jgi:hypothetical protein